MEGIKTKKGGVAINQQKKWQKQKKAYFVLDRINELHNVGIVVKYTMI